MSDDKPISFWEPLPSSESHVYKFEGMTQPASAALIVAACNACQQIAQTLGCNPLAVAKALPDLVECIQGGPRAALAHIEAAT